MLTIIVGDVAVKFSLTFGKITKVWLITKACLNAFTHHIRQHNVSNSA
jgi:hypothetical protein